MFRKAKQAVELIRKWEIDALELLSPDSESKEMVSREDGDEDGFQTVFSSS